MVIKKSSGIACCRLNSENKPEILLIKKRNSYDFMGIVLGHYRNDTAEITKMLNNITLEEKLEILSLDFPRLWYKAFLQQPKNIEHYHRLKSKFDRTFVVDGGKRLRSLINCSTTKNHIWEIPKGRPNGMEGDLDCAVREFEEETGIKKKHYAFIPNFKRNYSFKSGANTYVYTYFLGEFTSKKIPKLDLRNFEQIFEISDMKWMTLEKIAIIDDDGFRLRLIVSPIFNYFRKYMQSRP
jgi:8-oxo-dGTP pyrophosphatase MutT (NUDIX family)